ncbi:Zinc/iron permease [Rhizodiscina lignyota]|uniref:Zinc/iron permease n=1 Tax=Rhizodiscina lignyota TaxID=1504668 RepID=A0A9P4ILS8_9PEZI|nr:Zinc/iron permease [Rhizodiscina lignyota]
MWDGFFLLLVLSTVMALASFLAGMLPLSLSLSSRQLRLITAIGTGVLVGTSLIVIIPEGVETLYSASNAGVHTDFNIKTAQIEPVVVKGGAGVAQLHRLHTVDQIGGINLGEREIPSVKVHSPRSPSPKDELDEAPPTEIKPPDEDEDEGPDAPSIPEHTHKEPPEPHAYIGLALILGFILMYLIDVLPTTSAQFLLSRRRPSRPLHISLSSLHRGVHDASLSSPSASPALAPADMADNDPSAPQTSPPTTTLGLVIHAIADGIALGASTASASSNPNGASQNLGIVVFLALMLHKAPAAFGLTAVLLKQGLSTRAARAHLIIFALAAPVGAFATWVSVNLLGATHLLGKGVDEQGVDRGAWWTGVVLIFSGGTFLYVAMHSMQSASGEAHEHGGGGRGHARRVSELEGGTNGYLGNPYAGPVDYGTGVGRRKEEVNSGLTETVAMVVGMVLPLVVQMGHVH